MKTVQIDKLSTTNPLIQIGKPNRLVSIDVLRGLAIAFMILVDNNGNDNAFAPLKHAIWNGWTPTDLVYPAFIFVMGLSIVLSTEARLHKGVSRRSLCIQILRRSAILFLLGLVVNGFPFFNLHTLRIYGVLQRIALCYLIASFMHLLDRGIKSKVAVLVVALVGYWILVRWIPVPGFGMPGKDVPLMDMRANLPAYVDRLVFPQRLYHGYRDPEGLLGTLPAEGTTIIGMLTGLWLLSPRSSRSKAAMLLSAGIAGLLLGDVWGLSFPINKNMWTSSFVLLAAGFSLVLLAIFYYSLEVKAWSRTWSKFFLVFGVNAIVAYVFAVLLASGLNTIHIAGRSLKSQIYGHVFASLYSVKVASLAYAIVFVLVCWIFSYILYRNKILIKI